MHLLTSAIRPGAVEAAIHLEGVNTVILDGISVKGTRSGGVDGDGQDDLVILFSNGGGSATPPGVASYAASGQPPKSSGRTWPSRQSGGGIGGAAAIGAAPS